MSRNLYQVRIIDENCNTRIYGGNALFTSIKKASFPMRESGMIPIRRSRDGRESIKEYYDTMTKLTWVILDNDLSPQPPRPQTSKDHLTGKEPAMTDKEIIRKAQNLTSTIDAIASVSIDSLKTAIDIFHDTPDGEAVYNQEFPVITAKVEFLQYWIRYQKEQLAEAEKVADEILKLWYERYGI